ncbi:MAG: hypothetical protein JWR09_963 [Mucilaginibacter sp.]|nr:hypothetical protein [Mucilaginibacter sp.]
MDVSIIIPTYNRLWSLPMAVASCFASQLTIEVIIIDDGSIDGTWAWLQQQANIIAIKQQNMGKDWAVNAGFALANGKYIRFLDSDDWLLPGSTDKLFNAAESEGLEVVCAGYQLFDHQELLVKEISWTVCDDFIAQQLGECDSSHYSAYLFRKDFINDIPHRQEYGALDDRKFMIEIALKGPKIGYIDALTFAHRIHENERLQSPSVLQDASIQLARYNIYKKALQLLAERGDLTQRRKNACCHILWHLAHWVAKTDIKTGKEIYDWIFELQPRFKPNENTSLQRMYKNMGFVHTEKLLTFRRLLKR